MDWPAAGIVRALREAADQLAVDTVDAGRYCWTMDCRTVSRSTARQVWVQKLAAVVHESMLLSSFGIRK